MTTLQEPTLHLAAPQELNATNAITFRDHARTMLTDDTARLDVDLSRTLFIDSSGLGTLMALHKQLTRNGGVIRLIHPRQQVVQILELTRMHRLFDIVRQPAA